MPRSIAVWVLALLFKGAVFQDDGVGLLSQAVHDHWAGHG